MELAGSFAAGPKRRSGLNRGEPVQAVEQKGRTGRTAGQQGARSSRPGTLTPQWRPWKGYPLRASERPLRASGSVWEKHRLRRVRKL